MNVLVHLWRQFGLNWPVVTADLQHLSKVSTFTNDVANKFVSSGMVFEKIFPLLFESLYSLFGEIMSNSRLCKQIHRMMRHGFDPSIEMDQADHHRQYSSNNDCRMRQAR